jgi:hypothetical protein
MPRKGKKQEIVKETKGSKEACNVQTGIRTRIHAG